MVKLLQLFCVTSGVAAADDSTNLLQQTFAHEQSVGQHILHAVAEGSGDTICVDTAVGDIAPVRGSFAATTSQQAVEVAAGSVAEQAGSFCVPKQEVLLMQRTYGLNTARDIEVALDQKRSTVLMQMSNSGSLVEPSTPALAQTVANAELERQGSCSSALALLEEDSNSSMVISTPKGKAASRPTWEKMNLHVNQDVFMPGILSATNDMLVALVGGGEVDQKKIFAHALGKAEAAFKNVLTKHPISKAVTGVLFAFLGSLLGEDEDMKQDDFYDMIIDEVKDMILKDRIRNKLQDVLHNFQDEMRKRDFLRENYPDQYPLDVQNHDDEGTAIMYQRRIFSYQCWIGKYDHADCKEWEANGAVALGARFAHWHLQTLTEIAVAHKFGDYWKYRRYLRRIQQEGEQYVTVLRHSWETWNKAWQVKLKTPTIESRGDSCQSQFKTGHTCEVKIIGDDFTWPECPKSRSCYRPIGSKTSSWASWIQSWTACIAKTKGDKDSYLNSIKADIDKLDAIQHRAGQYISSLSDNDD